MCEAEGKIVKNNNRALMHMFNLKTLSLTVNFENKLLLYSDRKCIHFQ